MNRGEPLFSYVACIEHGRGTPFSVLHLVDKHGAESKATYLGATQRADDGEFYPWAWNGTRINIVMPPRLLPWSFRHRRTRLMARTIDGQLLGPFFLIGGERP